MQIKILDQEFTCKNEMPAVEQVFEQLSQWLEETGQEVVCLEINGVEVAEDYDQYIADHLNNIEIVVVKVKKLQQVLADTLGSVRAYLARAIPEIDKLVDQFYHEVTPSTWDAFSQLIEGLQFSINSLDALNQHAQGYSNAGQFVLAKENLSKKIGMLHAAMESQDRVWLSDVLLYEIVPVLNSLCMAIDTNKCSANVR